MTPRSEINHQNMLAREWSALDPTKNPDSRIQHFRFQVAHAHTFGGVKFLRMRGFSLEPLKLQPAAIDCNCKASRSPSHLAETYDLYGSAREDMAKLLFLSLSLYLLAWYLNSIIQLRKPPMVNDGELLSVSAFARGCAILSVVECSIAKTRASID